MGTRTVLPLICVLLLCGCRADLGRHVAEAPRVAAPAERVATSGTVAERMRSRWALTAATPARGVPATTDELSPMNVLQDVDGERLEAALEACAFVQRAKADRLAEACLPFSVWYGDAHCH